MIDKIKYRITVLKELLPFSKGVNKFIVINMIIVLFQTVLSIVNPKFYQIFIDDVILNRKIDMIFIVITGYIGIEIIRALLSYWAFYNNNVLKNRVTIKLKLKLIDHIFHKNFSYYDCIDAGEMRLLLDDDIEKLKDFYSTQTVNYFIEYIKMAVLLIFILIMDWHLATYTVAIIPITFLLDHVISKKEKNVRGDDRNNYQQWSSWLTQVIVGWKEVKALNLNEYELSKFDTFSERNAYYFKVITNWWTTRVLVIPQIKEVFFKQFLLYFIGGILILNSKITIGVLLVFAQYYSMLAESVKTVSGYDADLQTNMVNINKIIDELKSSYETEENKISSFENCDLCLENVTFCYDGSEKNIVDGLNIKIKTGERVAVVGKSGAGKTTILKLMAGMLNPTHGKVTFAGNNLKDVSLEKYHKKLGFVLQENFLFNATIRENLLYANPKATDKMMIDACKKAYIYDFINELPKGLDTVIGERGMKLSGGQRQRIVLARLFLRDVDIFIFDEATSALDQHSENIVHDAIKEIGRDKTIIIVSHRKSSISICDNVIEMRT